MSAQGCARSNEMQGYALSVRGGPRFRRCRRPGRPPSPRPAPRIARRRRAARGPADQRLLHGAPAQAGQDGLDAAPRAGAVAAGADIERAGQALGRLQQGIVGAVEEILQRAAHVAEVLGRAEDDRLGGQHVVGAGLQRRHDARPRCRFRSARRVRRRRAGPGCSPTAHVPRSAAVSHEPGSNMIKKLLIANRGEIAIRIAAGRRRARHRHGRRPFRGRRHVAAREAGRRGGGAEGPRRRRPISTSPAWSRRPRRPAATRSIRATAS